MKCNNCKKKGHFAKVCISAVAVVREVVVPELAILCVDDLKFVAAAFDKITCQMDIEAPQGNSHVLELIVDTGAAVSILPEPVYRQHFAHGLLTEPKVKLVTYVKGDPPVTGCLKATVAIASQENKVPALFYIVKA